MSPRPFLGRTVLGVDLAPSKVVALALIALACFAIAFLPLPVASPNAALGLAIVAFTVAMWATSLMPALHTGIAFFALGLASGVVPAIPLFSGFWSNAAMLVIGGLVIGGAAERTGLGRYVSRALTSGIATYPRLIASILAGSTILNFLVPSTMGRLAIMIPILAATAKEAGYEPGSRGYTGIMLAAVVGNYLTSYGVLPANITNVLALGTLETLGGPTFQYGAYLLMCWPLLGLLKTVIVWAAVCLFLPAPAPMPAKADDAPLSPEARRLAILLAITVLLWMSDVVHHLKPGWISLAAGLVCLVPVLRLGRPKDILDISRLTAIISLAAVIGVAAVLTHSGAGALIANTLASLMPTSGASPALGFMLLSLSTSLIAIGATIPGGIAIMTPTLSGIESTTDLPQNAGLIAMLIGLQSPFFAYEAVPVMVGLMMAKVPASAATRILAPLAITGILVLAPLQIAWLKLLGAMP